MSGFAGYRHSEETKRKISEAKRGHSFPNSGSFKRGLVPYMAGKKHKPETLIKMSLAKKGKHPWNYGLTGLYKPPLSEETKRKIGLANTGKHSNAGAKNWNWRGGISSETKKRTNTPEWKKIRKIVYQRDNWTCQHCGKKCHFDIQCHHVIPYDICKHDNIENLTTLCKSCHLKQHVQLVQSHRKHNLKLEMAV